jgi:hypothetical protein
MDPTRRVEVLDTARRTVAAALAEPVDGRSAVVRPGP